MTDLLIEFLKGFVVGLFASVPLGPIGVLCIQRTLSRGRNSGLISGLGSAVTDTVFAAISLFSISIVQGFISDYRSWVMLVGGLIVVGFGVKLFMTNPVKQMRRIKYGETHYWQDFFSTVLMTITNPAAFFLILGLFALIGINHGGDVAEPLDRIAVTMAGVFVGAALWWYALSTGINMFRKKLRLRQLIMINRIAGIVILVLGLISFFEGLYKTIIV